MNVTIQLIQVMGETVVEVSGIREVNELYLENADVDVSTAFFREAEGNKIRLLIKPGNHKMFTPFSFDIPIHVYRMVLDRLLNESKIIITANGLDENLDDVQAIKNFLQTNGGIWIDELPKEVIGEIVKYRLS